MVLLYRSSSDSAILWLAELRKHIPELEMRVFPELGEPRDIDAALVWKPQPGLLASLPNLKMIVSLGAGVDHLLEDATLPRHVPIVRLVDPYMTEAMSEYVLTQVLRLHRLDFAYRTQQRERVWRELPQPNAAERRVGVLGLGELGSDAARKLAVFGFKVAGWVAELDRTIARLANAAEEAAVGRVSGAVGTHATIDPRVEDHVCSELGLRVDVVSTQVVARDRHSGFMSALAIAAGTLERIATEIRHLQRSEIGEVFEPFGKEQKGSSAMPHKRNPVLTERVCGLARVVRGNLVTALENTALWHERDISHSSA